MADLAAAVERGDIDELIGVVNGLCLDGDWPGLEELARRCRAALERGRQLWPVAAHADYRLALEAPPRFAAAAVAPGRGRFAPGPLAEVAASTHAWDDLAPHLGPDPLAAVVAQERVLRGEDLSGDRRVDASVMELPLRLADWEPPYALATYHADRAEFPAPVLEPAGRPVGVEPAEDEPVGPGGAPGDGDTEEARRALLDLVGAWTTESSGRAEAVAARGGAADAARRLSVPVTSVVPVTPASAVAVMAWAGASGGAHGRRRGAAAGRFAAWWAVAALAGLLDEWPPGPDAMADAVAGLTFWGLEEPGPATGWRLALAVERPAVGTAWAVWAADPASPAPSTG